MFLGYTGIGKDVQGQSAYVEIVLPLCFRYASIMLPNEGGTNHIFENRDTCVWLARAQARAIIANVRIMM